MSTGNTVILVTADSLQYDVLEREIGGSPCCPFLQDLADSGIEFASAYATGTGTSAAFPGLLAGSYPFDYGYRGLADGHVPIAEHLQSEGVRTIGVTASSHTCSLFNYDRGFDRFYENPAYRPDAPNTDSLPLPKRLKQSAFDVVRSMPVAREAGSTALDIFRSLREGDDPSCPFERATRITDKTTELVEEDLQSHPSSDRFVWIHYMEPHGPYLPPKSVLEQIDTAGYTLSDVDELWTRWFDSRPELGEDGSSIFTGEEQEILELFYLAQARYLDEEMRRLHEFVENRIGYGNATLLFTSDHGEEFFEHGDLGHRPKLVDELIHIPLLAYSGTGEQGSVRDELVSHVDIGPTVAAGVDVAPHEKWQGKPLKPVLGDTGSWDGREAAYAEVCHTEGYGGEVRLEQAVHAVYTDEWKYVRNVRTDEESLYRRGTGGTSEHDVAATEPAIDDLRELVEQRRADVSDRAVDRDELSEDVRDRLHRLGYVGE